jgi:hypothetical protein
MWHGTRRVSTVQRNQWQDLVTLIKSVHYQARTRGIDASLVSAKKMTFSQNVWLCLFTKEEIYPCQKSLDRLCGLVVRVLGYRSGGPGSIPGTTRKKSSGSGTGSTRPREYN